MLVPCSVYAYERVVENRLENDREILSAAGQCLRDGNTEDVFYVTGKNYVPEGTVLKNFYGDALEYSVSLEEMEESWGDRFWTMRFAVKWKKDGDAPENGDSGFLEDLPAGLTGETRYWKIGDQICREIGGQSFVFRCIDQNYHGAEDAGQTGALFLCDQVIPWNVGSYSAYERLEDGSYGYVYHPGPVERFGDEEEYKYSAVRSYLQMVAAEWEENGYQLQTVFTGQKNRYTGQTKERSFEQFQEGDLVPHRCGYQQMTDRVFLLSVEEALRYRKELWAFGDMDWLLPASSRYWLRTAMGSDREGQSGQAYAVDLIRGWIAPVEVSEPCGLRPAFVLEQKE